MTTPAFLTGSYAYGTPRPDSDVDVVVLIEDQHTLWAMAQQQRDPQEGDAKASGSDERPSLRFGPLNLIVVRTREEYEAWRQGTAELRARAPVTREEACAHLRAHCDPVKA